MIVCSGNTSSFLSSHQVFKYAITTFFTLRSSVRTPPPPRIQNVSRNGSSHSHPIWNRTQLRSSVHLTQRSKLSKWPGVCITAWLVLCTRGYCREKPKAVSAHFTSKQILPGLQSSISNLYEQVKFVRVGHSYSPDFRLPFVAMRYRNILHCTV